MTLPGTVEAVPVDDPTTPKTEDGRTLPWPAAPEMMGVQYVPNRDSVIVLLPVVDGARDYRIYRLPEGSDVTVASNGNAHVTGTDIYCAGWRQHNARALPDRVVLRQIEVAGLSGDTTLVVEAIDAACPFTGLRGSKHKDVVVDNVEIPTTERKNFSFYSEQEIRTRYGSLIINGHGPAQAVGQPADPVDPKVLARTTIKVSLSAPAITADFFDDFSDSTSQPTLAEMISNTAGRSQQGKRYENAHFNFYTFGAEYTDLYVDRGALHSALADWGQDIFASNLAVPKTAAQLSDTDYLHITYEVPTDSSARRYWWLSVCGSDTPGETLDATGKPKTLFVQTPFFYQDDGLNPSLANWNCFELFPRDGWPFPLPPGKTRPESDVRVMVNVANTSNRSSVRNVSPDQYGDPDTGPPGWYRQQKPNGMMTAPMLDDQLLISPRTKFDVYLRRDRAVLFVNGEQRLCNDFPNVKLTMADAAVIYGQVLYHSAAEREEFSVNYNVRTGQLYYLENTPFADSRDWDNVGFTSGVAAPTTFDSTMCYVYTGM